MRFGLPLLLSLLCVTPLLAGVTAWGIRRRRLAAARFAGSGLPLLRSGQASPVWRRVKIALFLSGVGLLLLEGVLANTVFRRAP